MDLFSLPLQDRLDCLVELLGCGGAMYVWEYSPEGRLCHSNCPDKVLDTVFDSGRFKEVALTHAATSRAPLVMSNSFGMIWSAATAYNDKGAPEKIYVLGPVMTSELSYEAMRDALHGSRVPPHWRPKLIKILMRVPVSSTLEFFKQTLMFHYCISGEKLTTGDIVFSSVPGDEDKAQSSATKKKDRLITWKREQMLMQMVTEGNLDYKDALHDAAQVSAGVRLAGASSLEQAKASQITFIALCTRAAIQGGISPEIAYTRGDASIQDILKCKNVTDAAQIGHAMYDDFIHLVHASKTKKEVTPQIRSCLDYIDLHVEDKITLQELASRIGYTDYYLSRKFKEEMGQSVNDYIKIKKVDRAKLLLETTELSIPEICERLHFGSRSFFAETFKSIEGTPPAAYRAQHRRL